MLVVIVNANYTHWSYLVFFQDPSSPKKINVWYCDSLQNAVAIDNLKLANAITRILKEGAIRKFRGLQATERYEGELQGWESTLDCGLKMTRNVAKLCAAARTLCAAARTRIPSP